MQSALVCSVSQAGPNRCGSMLRDCLAQTEFASCAHVSLTCIQKLTPCLICICTLLNIQQGSAGAVQVMYSLGGGASTATANVDHSSTSDLWNSLTFADGVTERTITIPILQDNTVCEQQQHHFAWCHTNSAFAITLRRIACLMPVSIELQRYLIPHFGTCWCAVYVMHHVSRWGLYSRA